MTSDSPFDSVIVRFMENQFLTEQVHSVHCAFCGSALSPPNSISASRLGDYELVNPLLHANTVVDPSMLEL